ncbi:MAG: zinc-ribbon domain-containing protein [Lachnospiraceae bacterium]|jgi:hypothetical protein|nr:zinc-ribbon domain-containing protein [Lachnospiraceae bacterium]MBP5264394.1 zinc-ribbon domain-containing protein [Lachnospiraceae bacterium]MBQ6095012.1 zinc-ribbon domain-containing protein [Lachnospiraceae bacterium]
MGAIYYGTRTFSKHVGYFGPVQECVNCQRSYKKAYVKYSSWFHIDYIPIVPTKTVYFKACPVCGHGVELKSKEAKAEMAGGDDGSQVLTPHVKHVLSKKPKGIMKADNSYELWLKDEVSGEDILIAGDVEKEVIKSLKKERGYKKVPTEKVE